MHFREWKVLYFYQILSKFFSKVPIDNNPVLDSDNGLALYRQQAIIRTNADLICWRIYAALGGDELTKSLFSIV